MTTPNDDPALQQFLALQAKPSATAEELAKLGSHTRSNPLPKRRPDRTILVIVIVVVSLLGRMLVKAAYETGRQRQEAEPVRLQLTQEQARDILRKLNSAKSIPPEPTDTTEIESLESNPP